MPTTHGGAAGPYRQELVAYWQQRCSDLQVAVSEGYSLSKLLVSPVELRDWALQGLPTDGVSVDNGTLVTRTHRWPLMIDPQEQGRRWVSATQRQRMRCLTAAAQTPAEGPCQRRVGA